MSDKPRVRIKATNDSLSKFNSKLGGYSNPVSGLGMGRDKGTQGQWEHSHFDFKQIEAMYRTSWTARRGVDTPALDMLRQGWTWGLTPEEQEKLDGEWDRLDGEKTIRQALIWARLYGGAGIYIGTDDEDISKPLKPDALKNGGVKYLTAIPKHYLVAVHIDTDPISPSFGLPPAYRVASSSKTVTEIHQSRIIRLIGNMRPAFIHSIYDTWGDSVLEVVQQTISDFAAGQRGIGNLVQEANLDVISIEGFMNGLADQGVAYMDALIKRTQLNMDMKSSLNALVLDAKDSYDQKTANFSNLHELGLYLLKLVAASFGMPMTKFFGQAPTGLNSTGEGDERNYHDTISSAQETNLRPALQQLFAPIKASAGLSSTAGKLQFNPLRQMSEKEAAELNERNAKTIETYARSQMVPDGVLAAMARGAIIEAEQTWPGARKAYEQYTDEDGNVLSAGLIEPTEDEMNALGGDATI